MTSSALPTRLRTRQSPRVRLRTIGDAADEFRRSLEIWEQEPQQAPVEYLRAACGAGQALLMLRQWHAAILTMDRLLSNAASLIHAEPSWQRQRTMLEQLSGVGDDLAAAFLS